MRCRLAIWAGADVKGKAGRLHLEMETLRFGESGGLGDQGGVERRGVPEDGAVRAGAEFSAMAAGGGKAGGGEQAVNGRNLAPGDDGERAAKGGGSILQGRGKPGWGAGR